MLNRVEIEGYVTNRIWTWTEPGKKMPDTLFRLATYPDHEHNAPADRGRPFYVTVRVPGSVINGIPVGIRPEQHLTVIGQLVSRDYTHTLNDFLARVGAEVPLPPDFDPERVIELRSLNEVIVQSIQIIPDGDGDGQNKSQASRAQRRRARSPAVEVSLPGADTTANRALSGGAPITSAPPGNGNENAVAP